jgi:hypothetical protein
MDAKLPTTSAARLRTSTLELFFCIPSIMPAITPLATVETMFSSARVRLPTARRAMLKRNGSELKTQSAETINGLQDRPIARRTP